MNSYKNKTSALINRKDSYSPLLLRQNKLYLKHKENTRN